MNTVSYLLIGENQKKLLKGFCLTRQSVKEFMLVIYLISCLTGKKLSKNAVPG